MCWRFLIRALNLNGDDQQPSSGAGSDRVGGRYSSLSAPGNPRPPVPTGEEDLIAVGGRTPNQRLRTLMPWQFPKGSSGTPARVAARFPCGDRRPLLSVHRPPTLALPVS